MTEHRKSQSAGVEIVPACDRPQEVGALFAEYTQMLVANEPSFQEYLNLQHYGEELNHLEAKYGPPGGRLYLAYDGGDLAGCIGLRRIDAERCEMKRLYVRPRFRGRRIGDQLIRRIIEDARATGYACMLLDTLPFLQSAIRMYRRFGFYEIPSYTDSPMESSIYMRLDL